MKKNIFLLLIALAISTNTTWAQSFAGGDGTAAYPWKIATPAQLDDVRNYLDKHFILISNIDLATYLATGGGGFTKWGTAGWLPIGDNSDNTDATRFTGSFDGDGFKVTGLTINRSGDWAIGLFGIFSSSGVIQNLGVEIGIDGVKGDGAVGGLVGLIYSGSISNCYATGDVSGYSYVGGLVGGNAGTGTGSISNCYATGDVTATGKGIGIFPVGGLVGLNSGSISDCHATGAVSGTNSIGGLAGINDSTGSISNCYATGDVSGTNDAGGLVGLNSGSISDCHATGAVSGTDSIGGLAGSNGSTGSISNCFATGDVCGTSANGFTSSVGGLVGSNSGTISNCYAASVVSGTCADYYTNGLNVGGLVGLNSGSISYCHATGDVTSASKTMLTYYPVGGLVGRNDSTGSISDCYSTSDVTDTGTDNQLYKIVGGLVGWNSGSISNCYATGDVSGTGTVSINNYIVGGLVGLNTGSISNCYATGAVSGIGIARYESFDFGGLVGLNSGSISNCYATGAVSGTGTVYNELYNELYNFGGFIGRYIGGTLTDNFFDTETTGQANGIGNVASSIGFTGKTTADMKKQSTFAGWDFTTTLVWGIDGSYPYLQGIQTIIVTFNKDDGSPTDNVTVNTGAPVAKPTEPTHAGFIFDGWYNGTTAWDFATPITAPTTLTAHWTTPTITITTQPSGANIYLGNSHTLSVSATSTGTGSFTYQWFKDGTSIPGATSATYTISNAQFTDGGSYTVVVTLGALSATSAAAVVNVSTPSSQPNPPDPIVQHSVFLPFVQGISTNPSAGAYNVSNSTDFVFALWPLNGYYFSDMIVSTDRGNEISLSQEDGKVMRVTVKNINAPTTIHISGVRAVDNEPISSSRVWGYDGKAYFSLAAPAEVSIYTISGMLFDQRTLPAGDTSIQLPAGIYIIRIAGKAETKILIN